MSGNIIELRELDFGGDAILGLVGPAPKGSERVYRFLDEEDMISTVLPLAMGHEPLQPKPEEKSTAGKIGDLAVTLGIVGVAGGVVLGYALNNNAHAADNLTLKVLKGDMLSLDKQVLTGNAYWWDKFFDKTPSGNPHKIYPADLVKILQPDKIKDYIDKLIDSKWDAAEGTPNDGVFIIPRDYLDKFVKEHYGDKGVKYKGEPIKTAEQLSGVVQEVKERAEGKGIVYTPEDEAALLELLLKPAVKGEVEKIVEVYISGLKQQVEGNSLEINNIYDKLLQYVSGGDLKLQSSKIQKMFDKLPKEYVTKEELQRLTELQDGLRKRFDALPPECVTKEQLDGLKGLYNALQGRLDALPEEYAGKEQIAELEKSYKALEKRVGVLEQNQGLLQNVVDKIKEFLPSRVIERPYNHSW